ncbi:MAG: phosphate acyltransferase [Moraxella sp.]
MISYSTGSSGEGADDKVRQATEIAKAKAPDLLIDGSRYNMTLPVSQAWQSKAPNSLVAGRFANVFIFRI